MFCFTLMITGWSINNSRTTVYQFCVTQTGATRRTSASSAIVFLTTELTRLKGGKAYIKVPFQSRAKASIASASGSGIQATYLLSCLFSLDANISISGFPNKTVNSKNNCSSNIHSILSLNLRELSSAKFSIPRTYAAESQMLLSMHHNHICLAKRFSFSIFPPI